MNISRRSLLIGGGAAVASLGTGGLLVNHASPTLLRRLTGGCHGMDAPASTALVTLDRLASRAMGGTVEYAISRPAGHAADPLPVVIGLHGRGGSAREVMGIGFTSFVADAVARGTAAPFAVAAVDGGDSTYWHKRASGLDPMAMLLDEFVPLLRSRHGLGGTPSTTAVCGWSMGGYGALLAAETAPDVYGAVVATSPAFWWSYAEARDAHPDTFDGEADWAAHDVGKHAPVLAKMPVRLDCGDLDPFRSAVVRLQGALPSAEGGIAPGCHDGGFWRTVSPAQVTFLNRFFTSH